MIYIVRNTELPFTEIRAETIISAFAKQLKAMRQKQIATMPHYIGLNTGSLLLAFEQQQHSDRYNGAGKHIPAYPQRIILIGRPARNDENELYRVQGIFSETGKADRLTEVAQMPDLEVETAVREVMLQRNIPSRTKIGVRPVDLDNTAGSVEPVSERTIAPLLILRSTKSIRPRVTLG